MDEVMLVIPQDRNTLLTRDATAAALTESGYPTSPKTLATKASRGGGPSFRHFGPVFFSAGAMRLIGQKIA
jgi:hypothetical protein